MENQDFIYLGFPPSSKVNMKCVVRHTHINKKNQSEFMLNWAKTISHGLQLKIELLNRECRAFRAKQ